MQSARAATAGQRRSQYLLAVAVAAAALTATACGSSPTATTAVLTTRNVVVEAVPATGATGLYIAKERGYFAAAGLNVTIKSSASAALTVPDLLNGSANVSLGQWTSALAVEAHGGRLRVLASGNNGGPGLEEIVTMPNSLIQQLPELRNRKVAVNALSGLSQMLVDSILATAGVPPAQVHFVVFPFPLMGAALANHQVDAAFMIEPYLSKAEETLGTAELTDLDQGATQDFPITGYFASAAWADKNPATAAAFTTALERGQAIAAVDRAAAEQAMVQFIRISPTTASVMSLGTFPLGINTAQLRRVADLMQVNQLLPKSVSPAAIVAAMTASSPAPG
jgi:NitT/TauT family transport system substrate-binding protein